MIPSLRNLAFFRCFLYWGIGMVFSCFPLGKVVAQVTTYSTSPGINSFTSCPSSSLNCNIISGGVNTWTYLPNTIKMRVESISGNTVTIRVYKCNQTTFQNDGHVNFRTDVCLGTGGYFNLNNSQIPFGINDPYIQVNAIMDNNNFTSGSVDIYCAMESYTAGGANPHYWAGPITITANTTYPPTCSGTNYLSSCSSSFSDGSGGSNYGNSQTCGWLIQPSGASSITLNFSSFDTEYNYDFVNVYDGTNAFANLLGSYSGSSIPSSVTSTGGNMYVEFTTDGSYTYSGWDAYYSCSNTPVCNISLSTSPTNASCGQNDGTMTVYGYGVSSYEYNLNGNGWTWNNYFTGLASGWYDVYIRDANNPSCTNYTSEYVGSNGNPPVISTLYDFAACLGSTLDIQNPSVSGASSYQWYRNGSPVAGQTNPTLQFPNPGITANDAGSYYLMAYGSCAVPSNTVTISVVTLNASITVTSNSTQNGSLITIQSFNDPNANSHTWTVQAPNGVNVINAQVSQNLSFTPTMNGDYKITHIAVGTGCNQPYEAYLNITPNYSNNSAVGHSLTPVYKGDPVNTATGEYTYAHDIMSVAARNAVLNFKVFYMGQNLGNNELGYGWRHNWQIKMTRITAPSGDLEIRFPNGRTKYFTEFVQTNTPRCVKTYLGETDTLIKNGNNTYTLRQPDGTQYVFDNATGNLLSLTDLNNTTFTLTYTAGKLTKITAPGGRYIDLFYTGNALTSVKNQENHTAYFLQDANNDLVKITNVRNGEFDFAYYSNTHLVHTVTDPNNNVFVTNVYTGNKVTLQTLADLGTFIFQYNTPVANATTVTDQLSHSEVFYYDANWNLIQQKDANNVSQYWTYNANRMLETYVDELNHTTTFGIAANGNVSDIWSPTQRHTHSNFTALNRPDAITNALNVATTIVYNPTTGNPTEIHLPNTGVIYLTYFNDGTVQNVTDAMGRIYGYLYNPQGDVATIVTPTGNITLQYDLIGRVRFITDQLLHDTEIQYDNWGNITKVISEMGAYEQFTYDDNGNMLTYRNRNNFITTFTYDNMDRLHTIVQPGSGNRTTTFTYTLTGKIERIDYPNLGYILNTYDAKDRLIQRRNILGGISTMGYLANSLVEDITLPNTYHIHTTYTDENEAKISYDGYVRDSLFHNAVGNVIKSSDDQGHFSLYQFDNMNQLVGVNEGNMAATTLGMNLNGELTSVTDPNSHTNTTTLQANTGFPVTQTDAALHSFSTTFSSTGDISGGTDARNITNTITLNANDEMIGVAWSNGEYENFVPDNSGFPTTFGNQNGNFVLTKDAITDEIIGVNGPFTNDNVAYTHDNMGLTNTITYEPNKTVTNAFNFAGQNTDVTDWLTHTVHTNMDNMGMKTGKTLPNGIVQTLSHNTKGEVLINFWQKANGDTVFYQAFGRSVYGDITAQTRVPRLYPHFQVGVQNNTFLANDAQSNAALFTSDNNGNILTFPIDTLNTPATATYDAKNRMITLAYGATTIQNYYDAMNLLIKQVKNGVTRLYIWDIANGLPHIIRETNGSGVTIASYVWADGMLISRIDASANVLYYVLDYKGNVVALVDAAANVIDQYAYGTFGENMKHIGTTNQPFTWMGGYGILHQEGNLYYIRQRWHLGSENRFLSQDVFPADAAMTQTLNRYVYGLNDGNRWSDVTGLYGQDIKAILKGFNLFSDVYDYSKLAEAIYKNPKNAGNILANFAAKKGLVKVIKNAVERPICISLGLSAGVAAAGSSYGTLSYASPIIAGVTYKGCMIAFEKGTEAGYDYLKPYVKKYGMKLYDYINKANTMLINSVNSLYKDFEREFIWHLDKKDGYNGALYYSVY